jgi:hypothetical protein
MFSNIKRLRLLALGAALLIVVGCGGSDGGGDANPTGGGDTTPPSLVSMTPDNGTDRVPTNTPVVATFSEPIDPASISTANFGAVERFVPDDYFAPTTNYSAQLGLGVMDLAGNEIAGGAARAFTTAALPTAAAGGDVVASLGQPFQLDGSASTLAPRIPGLTYEWIQLSGPDVGGPFSGETPTITAPGEVGSLIFQLSVFEDGTKSATDEVTVVVVEDASTAIFVDAGASGGDGSFASPFGTLVEALATSSQRRAGIPCIYLAAGTYAPGLIRLTSEVHFYGGFASESWERDPVAHVTRVEGAATAFRLEGASGSVLDGLHIVAADAAQASGSSIGVHLLGSTDVEVRNCVIEAGNGSKGIDGMRPERPVTQSKGGKGDDHGGCIPANVGGGGGGGSSSDAQGGKGGSGGLFGGADGGNGEGAGGGGGDGGATYKDGSGGDAGTAGGRGSDGSPGRDFAGIGSAGHYEGLLARGGTGGRGGRGGAGGGGGGGGGTGINCGAGGGGGGEGGYGGYGGSGGYGGGASIGVLVALESSVDIVGCDIITADGGEGGTGGDGGAGGYGGAGGAGGAGRAATTFTARRGAGGKGGKGGAGGPGGYGAGGGGGPSLGILQSSDSSAIVDAVSYSLGNAGPGGPPHHEDGLAGNDGITAEFKVVDAEVPTAPEQWETAR